MTVHDAIHKLIDAYRTQGVAMQYCTQPSALNLMAQVREKIYEVGEERFGREFIATLRESQVD